ncbi:hypothetical protein ALQ04_00119 [Pseudomonas cichorii]|uniref:Uncharacterized protein n=1 Tax=Pseudomonas cichorii TaxID=36746 RepID=A0A3M4M117_PSECI|nr:hypothetical protein [Pseudomonas cichorii]RMQ46994.1 hypothetical protein ALQ04_00119 [Pseudomonas cichorii]
MVEHDFRYSMLNPQHTLIECRTLGPGRYQVTGNGGSIHNDDQLLVTIKGSKSLYMRLAVEKVRHLINPPGQWVAVANGPAFDELSIHQWKVNCDSCSAELDFEFMVESKLGTKAQKPAAVARIAELGWKTEGEKHTCRKCQEKAA